MKKIFSLALALLLLISIAPVTAQAEPEPASKIIDISELQTGDIVYYGSYAPYQVDGSAGDLAWTVKEQDTLLANTNIDYEKWGTSNADYQSSSIHEWLNSSDGFLELFNAKERGAAGFELPTLAQIRAWFPATAEEEAEGVESRYCYNNPYWSAKAEAEETIEDLGANGHTVQYWLQDTVPDGDGIFDNAAYVIDWYGSYDSFVTCFPVDEEHAVRPVMSLQNAKGYASVTGTEDVKENPTESLLTTESFDRTFKLSLIIPEENSDFGTLDFGDSTLTFFADDSGALYSNLEISLSNWQAGQDTSGNNYIGLYVLRDNQVIYYDFYDPNSGSDAANFQIPGDVRDCKLMVYYENCNDPYHTDYLTSETELNPQVTVLRFVFLAAGGALGLFGISLLACGVLVNICATEDYGFPYMAPLSPFKRSGMGDTAVRSGIKKLQSRGFTVEEYHE